jgi:hypothetical protein
MRRARDEGMNVRDVVPPDVAVDLIVGAMRAILRE